MSSKSPSPERDEDGLILPRKVVNPMVIPREIQREFMINQRRGKKPSYVKSELHKVLAIRRMRQEQKNSCDGAGSSTELNKVLAERAKRVFGPIEKPPEPEPEEEDKCINKDLVAARARLRKRTDMK